ncbi:MAG: hypothetical protein HZA90_15375 [Verrucomicrobia bacterium]|nr:hypothetical protein [Verrucomicrobiota bacterium]
MKTIITILVGAGLFLAGSSASNFARAAEATSEPPAIHRIYIAHFSHTDFGFTDLQSVCRELQRRYLDIALDAVLATMAGPAERKFYWTAESVVAVDDWWQAATPERREQFRRAVRSGQLEVAAMPFNQTPFLNAAQWRTMLHWLPEDLWQQFKPTVALQNDVNGFPRAGAMAVLDRGIRHLYMGINADSGGPPFARPSAFWWKMPDGRRLFVWLNLSYPDGYDFFESAHWRRGPVPAAADTRYRPPRAGDFFRTDEASLRAAHAQCLRRLDQLRRGGYAHDVLTISMTSHWRMDNDPPFLPLADFVAAWNQLGLKPELVFTTASKAIQAMEQAVGDKAPEYEGEFTDWWANGTASGPREVAASRLAKRLLAAAQSPLWGPPDAAVTRRLDALYKDLCLFDEHTWGSSMSVAQPWTLDTQAQFNEKAAFAFKPMAHAEWLLSQRVRTRLLSEGAGLLVANPSAAPFSGWVRLIATCLRGDFNSVERPDGSRVALRFENGVQPWGRPSRPGDLTREDVSATFSDNAPRQVAKFWIEKLDGNSIVKLRLSPESAEDRPPQIANPTTALDPSGWPASAQWPGMSRPLFLPGLGDFVAVKVKAFAPRWKLHDMAGSAKTQRDQLRQEAIEETRAAADGSATVSETPHTLLYEQPLRHPRLTWATRKVELWKREARARLTLRLCRRSSCDPEILFAEFPLPCEGTLPTLTCGGMPFTPYRDQIPGSCRDYFAIDGWAHYATPNGHWLWVSRDAPLMTLGAPQVWQRLTTAPADTHRVLAMLFNNFWYTNFAADEHGVMEFQFDLVWREKLADAREAAALAETLTAGPVVLLNDSTKDHPIVLERLFRP